ncbi:uncharacterized protein BT62DRAFT_758549 [Guyanagaster necrorhizus]|uniref:Uncharacterized protein n=1 Tax=Guyanagaster necrorhizus TaxID=856835 RepID=A0A9P7VWI3_9AGAR|nr:uncharacterized protein BT62DRAFT_758549 [Guyanagaster necrorhizus MCA 3950]KAG7448202.1 hypothetical protein BT62DRAFT_758549 [Guyanagaster necrorhizus MCA 3950]
MKLGERILGLICEVVTIASSTQSCNLLSGRSHCRGKGGNIGVRLRPNSKISGPITAAALQGGYIKTARRIRRQRGPLPSLHQPKFALTPYLLSNSTANRPNARAGSILSPWYHAPWWRQ